MQKLRYLLAVTLLCALSTFAKAASVDFQVVVIDPPPGNFLVIGPSTPEPINVTWGSCSNTPAPTFDDCFTVVNDTGHDITNLSLFIPNTTNTDPNPCGNFSNPALDVFSIRSCTNSNGGFLLNFAGGIIPSVDADDHNGEPDFDDPHSTFTIAVDINGDGSLPNGTLALNSPIATPEPSSLLLLSTGLLGGGGMLLGDWRRRILGKASR